MNDPLGIHGDATPFLLDIAGTVALVLAGHRDHGVAEVRVAGKPCAVGEHGWISEPMPVEPGMDLQIAWLNSDGDPIQTITTGPLEPDKLRPIFGSGWTSYGPLTAS